MPRMSHHLVAVMAFLLLSGCFGGSSNTAPPTPLEDIERLVKIKELWTAHIGSIDYDKRTKLTPVLSLKTIFAADSEGRVVALSDATGKAKWRIRLEEEITAGVGAGAAQIYLGTKQGKVLALKKSDGELVWGQAVSSEILAPPVEADGMVVVQTVDGKIFALSAATGERQWFYRREVPPLSLRGTSTPVVLQGVVVSGFADGAIAALSLADGRFLWEIPVTRPRGRNEIERLVDVDIQPLILGPMLYIGSYQGNLVAIDLKTGRSAWKRDISTHTGLAADRDNIYYTDIEGNVVAVARSTGTSVWKQEKLRGRRLSPPAVVGEYVVVGDFKGYTHWLRVDDGKIVGRYQVGGDPIVARPIVDGRTVYISDVDAKITALRIQ